MDGAFLTGQMLIAMPAIGDPRFERALILLCAHDGTHAMGVAVNRPVEGLSVPDLLRRLDISAGKGVADTPVLMGGPVEMERGFVIHTDDYRAEHTIGVPGGYGLTATREVLVAMSQPGAGPRRAVLALGYAGWSGGQLESELRHNVWLTCEPDEALIFDDDHASKWTRALAKLGVDPKFLTAEAGRA